MSSADPPPDDDLVLEGLGGSAEAAREWDPWADAAYQTAVIGADADNIEAIFAADALFDMIGHGSDRTDREVGGILLGEAVQTSRGLMTRVADIIIADSNQSSLTHVTFTHDVWENVYAQLDQRDDGLRIVGWYHTHPGFGPFLSAHDRFIHENFFSHPRHVALVLDPVQHLVAVFAWIGGTLERLPGFLIYDDGEQSQELEQIVAQLCYVEDKVKKPRGIWSLFKH